MKYLVLLTFVLLTVGAQEVKPLPDYASGIRRSFTMVGSPNLAGPYGLGILGVGLNATVANGSVAAEVDALGFAMRNPNEAGGHKDLVFYLGAFQAKGSYNPSSSIGSVSASLAEVIASFSFIAPYYDRNGAPGFQWTPGSPFFCYLGIAQGGTDKDCIELAGIQEFKNKSWTTINTYNNSCPPSYSADCRVYTFITNTTDNMFSITLHLASEPVLINGVRVDPSFGKIDLTINFPWDSLNPLIPNRNTLKLALFSSYAGKAGTAGVATGKIDGASGLVFKTASKTAFFSWDGVAKIGDADRTVYAASATGQALLDSTCNDCHPLEQLAIASLKAAINIWKGFGWSTQFVIFSWDQAQPRSVFWDPKIGVEDENSFIVVDGMDSSDASLPIFTTLVAFLAMIVLH